MYLAYLPNYVASHPESFKLNHYFDSIHWLKQVIGYNYDHDDDDDDNNNDHDNKSNNI
jgi:hypothetical protein